MSLSLPDAKHLQLERWKLQYLAGVYDRPDLLADIAEMLIGHMPLADDRDKKALEIVAEWDKGRAVSTG